MSYSEQFDRAFAFASKLHRDQTRKGKDVPYINHLMGVASLVGTYGGDEEQVIAALLHDAVEDFIDEVPDIRAQIDEKFGPRVLEIVEGCTDSDTLPKPPWAARKQTYLDHLHALPADSPTLLVSLCDKVYNARAIVADLEVEGEILWERFNAKRAGSLWYYRVLSNIFLHKKPGYLANELKRLVEIMETTGESKDEPILYFFHGLESGPHGSKYQRLRESNRVFAPDFQGMDVWERLDKIECETQGLRNLIIVGSSYGGLLASLFYSRNPERVRGLVLMAPALYQEAADKVERMPEDAVVIHARQDDIVPIGPVREKCARHGIQLTEVDDNHRLENSHHLMLEGVRNFLNPDA